MNWRGIEKENHCVQADGVSQGRGKRGGVRLIYYFHSDTFPLFLLTVYAKNQKANLTRAERNDFQKLIPLLVKTYGKGRQV